MSFDLSNLRKRILSDIRFSKYTALGSLYLIVCTPPAEPLKTECLFSYHMVNQKHTSLSTWNMRQIRLDVNSKQKGFSLEYVTSQK